MTPPPGVHEGTGAAINFPKVIPLPIGCATLRVKRSPFLWPIRTMKIRLLLADDHPALLSGIKHDLAQIPTLEVVGEASDSGELVSLLHTTPCDVLVTDYAMPGGSYGDGMNFMSYLRRNFPDLKIVVFTMLDSPALVHGLARLGVHSVLGKVFETSHLISAIHAVYAGARYFPSEYDVSLPRRGNTDTKSAPRLTQRELEVVRLYVSGLSVNEIASRLNRSKQTISTQKSSAMRKLSIDRDADLFRYAYENGIAVASDVTSA